MKIDFVLTWVDMNDPKWQKEYLKYNKDIDPIKYRDWDNLKYWFRGVEKYASWVNKIHFITYGHLPSWLNANNPKLNIVNHKDYIPKEYLPTFNSHTIELNFHNIKDLAEHFVYFNDDTFIVNYLKPEDFFKNNLPCDYAILNPIISINNDHFSNIVTNNMALINRNFNKKECLKQNRFKYLNLKYGHNLIRSLLLMPWDRFPGFYSAHLPNAYLKSTFKTIWEKETQELHNTCLCKIRNNYTNVNQWIVKYWQYASGTFYPRNLKLGKYFEITDSNEELKKFIKNKRMPLVCLNDSPKISDFNKTKEELIATFESILSEKSSFEL